MSEPSKPFEKWTFTELRDAMAWRIVQAILKGQPIKDAMWEVCNTVVAWQKERKSSEPGSEKHTGE